MYLANAERPFPFVKLQARFQLRMADPGYSILPPYIGKPRSIIVVLLLHVVTYTLPYYKYVRIHLTMYVCVRVYATSYMWMFSSELNFCRISEIPV